ncbi:hypothetical protein EVA_22099 [gut metagenome]|uniref:Uncharacterized protein n=1 Tax=gut metagenome TaxID=749906 RepID=J9BQD4_9ZZZZ
MVGFSFYSIFKVRWQKSAKNKASASIVQTGADALL